MNVTEPIRYRARAQGSATAVIRADGSLVSYATLDRAVDGFAAALAEAGVRAGQLVGLAIGWPDEFPGIVASLALSRLGAASADFGLPAEHMDWCIVDEQRTKPGAKGLPLPVLWARSRVLPAGESTEHRHRAGLYRVFGSSGTTGSPKFLPMTTACMVARVHGHILMQGQTGVARICATGYANTVGFIGMLRTFWTGGTLVLTEPSRLVTAINRYRVAALMIAPASLRQVLETLPASVPPPASLASISYTGSAMPAGLRAEVERRLCRTIIGVYGTAEAGTMALGPLAALGDDPLAVGFVAPGVEVEAVDEDGNACPPGVEGLLRARGPYTVELYFADPAGSAEAFRDGWFQTDDMGMVLSNGLLRVSGRRSDVINTGGEKFGLREIEDVLLALPDVTDAAAFGVPDALGLAEPWAAIVSPQPIPEATLTAACQGLGSRAPRQVLFVTALPRNASGKVLRDELTRAAIAYRDGQTVRDAG